MRGRTVAAAAATLLALGAAVALGSAAPVPPSGPVAGHGRLDPASIPDAGLVGWLEAAGNLCPEVSAPLLAAQIAAESGWNREARSGAGALGIAQFLPDTFAAVGRDDNHNGTASPWDPADAIMAQGRYMCQLADQVAHVPGDPLANTLAAYNAGPARVLAAGGIPAIPETQAYVRGILASEHTYESARSAGGLDCRAPLLGHAPLGTPLGTAGSAWQWYGRHTGQDYLAAAGTPIVAACTGTITQVLAGGAYGNHVIEDLGTIDGHHITVLYAHMSRFGNIRAGQHVAAGAVIGYVGQTGNAFGAHLHFEVRSDFSATGPFSQFLDPPTFLDQHQASAEPPDGDATGRAAAAISAAKTQLDVPYAYGGGTLTGPSTGIAQGAGTTGWDCSALVRYAYYTASHGRLTLPRTSQAQAASPLLRTVHTPQPGDLIFYSTDGPGWTHVGIYLGGGKMIEAPRTGENVRIVPTDTGYYAGRGRLVRRPR